jgi:ABC-2 type transport system permease protein
VIGSQLRPRAPRTDLTRTINVVYTLAVADFRLKYSDSKLSYAWAVLRPLSLFAVLYAVFSVVGRFDDGVENYGIYLLTALMLWVFFADATARAVFCLVSQGKILRRLPLPHVAIPLSVFLTALFDLALNLVAVFAVILLAGLTPRVGWLELPLLIVLLSVLVMSVSMILSALYVRHRDVNQVWLVLRQLLFYGSPILYVAATLPDDVERLMMINPLAAIFTEMRHALIDPDAPTAAAMIGGGAWLLIPLGIVLVLVALSVWVFRRESPRVAESL